MKNFSKDEKLILFCNSDGTLNKIIKRIKDEVLIYDWFDYCSPPIL
jgi:hypothetical protein